MALEGSTRPRGPLLVTPVRVAPRRLDHDNAVAIMMGIREDVARWLRVDDGDARVCFVVEEGE